MVLPEEKASRRRYAVSHRQGGRGPRRIGQPHVHHPTTATASGYAPPTAASTFHRRQRHLSDHRIPSGEFSRQASGRRTPQCPLCPREATWMTMSSTTSTFPSRPTVSPTWRQCVRSGNSPSIPPAKPGCHVGPQCTLLVAAVERHDASVMVRPRATSTGRARSSLHRPWIRRNWRPTRRYSLERHRNCMRTLLMDSI